MDRIFEFGLVNPITSQDEYIQQELRPGTYLMRKMRDLYPENPEYFELEFTSFCTRGIESFLRSCNRNLAVKSGGVGSYKRLVDADLYHSMRAFVMTLLNNLNIVYEIYTEHITTHGDDAELNLKSIVSTIKDEIFEHTILQRVEGAEPNIATPCPACGEETLFMASFQFRSSDEPATIVFKCLSETCGHKFRED